MGLDTSHDCWHGAYSAFHRWRTKLMEVAFHMDLNHMQGFGGGVSWLPMKNDPLVKLLDHSDSDGIIKASDCAPLADRLEELLPALREAGDGGGHIGSYEEKTQQFIDGLRLAASRNEDVDFH